MHNMYIYIVAQTDDGKIMYVLYESSKVKTIHAVYNILLCVRDLVQVPRGGR